MDDVGERWLAAMRAGDFEAAWRQTDRIELLRRVQQTRPGFERQPHQLHWDGTPFKGRTVLIRCEHGLGDTLQFLRFVPTITQQARAVHLMVQPPLYELLRGAPGLGHVHDGWQPAERWPVCEVDIEIMELAYALRVNAATLPPPYPHVKERVEGKLVPPLAADGLKAGIVWAVSAWGHDRSAPLASLAPLFEVPGVHWYSLQQGDEAEDPLLRTLGVEPLSPRTRDIGAAASALAQLDLMVSVDAMPTHLAGMLGVPTWLLLKHEADWRWMQERADTPWYPSVRLLRQSRAGDWEGLAGHAAQALRERLRLRIGQRLHHLAAETGTRKPAAA